MRKYLLFGIALLVFGFASAKSAHAAYAPVPGDLLKTRQGHTVYYVDDNLQRIPMTAEAYKIRYNNDFSLVKIVDALDIGSFATFLRSSTLNSHPDGTLIVYNLDDSSPVYRIDHGFKRQIGTLSDMMAEHISIEWVGDYEIYATAH